MLLVAIALQSCRTHSITPLGSHFRVGRHLAWYPALRSATIRSAAGENIRKVGFLYQIPAALLQAELYNLLSLRKSRKQRRNHYTRTPHRSLEPDSTRLPASTQRSSIAELRAGCLELGVWPPPRAVGGPARVTSAVSVRLYSKCFSGASLVLIDLIGQVAKYNVLQHNMFH